MLRPFLFGVYFAGRPFAPLRYGAKAAVGAG